MSDAVRSVAILPIRLYQLLISPLLPANTCKYHPSCSEYAALAIRKHGVLRGHPAGAAGASCAATRGRTAGSTTHDRLRVVSRASCSPLENVMKSILDFFHTTSGCRGRWSIVALTIARPDPARPARPCAQIHSMQSLQAHAPEMKAIQQKYKGDRAEAQRGAEKFYKENNINPAASCLPTARAVPGLHRALLHAASTTRTHITGSWLHVVPNIADKATSHWSGYVLLAIYAGSQVASTYFMGTTMDKTQRNDHDGPAARLHHRRLAVPDRPRPLLDDDEPVDGRARASITRRLVPKPAPAGAAPPAARSGSSRTPRARPRRRPTTATAQAGEAEAARRRSRAASSGRRAAHAGEPSEVSVEATGETVGEAKWKALRDLERLAPGLDKASVRFQVVSEGERGLLGVGYTPARVIAAGRCAGCRAERWSRDDELRGRAAGARARRARRRRDRRRRSRRRARDDGRDHRRPAPAATLGLLIGKHGQTIDALQYVANAAVYRARRRASR